MQLKISKMRLQLAACFTMLVLFISASGITHSALALENTNDQNTISKKKLSSIQYAYRAAVEKARTNFIKAIEQANTNSKISIGQGLPIEKINADKDTAIAKAKSELRDAIAKAKAASQKDLESIKTYVEKKKTS